MSLVVIGVKFKPCFERGGRFVVFSLFGKRTGQIAVKLGGV